MKALMFALLFALGIAGLVLLGHQAPCTLAKPVPSTEVRVVLVDGSGGRVSAEGLPVPIYPGTRVTQAEVRPPAPPRPPRGFSRPRMLPRREAERPNLVQGAMALTSPAQATPIVGQLSATEPRAQADARSQLERKVLDWLAPDIPPAWKPPVWLIDRLIVATRTRPVVKDYGTLYETTLDVDFSSQHRAEFLEIHQRELVAHRLALLGGLLGFVLACLASVAGYIRADEATKGYYTNWLRMAATAGVGASGVLIYQLLT